MVKVGLVKPASIRERKAVGWFVQVEKMGPGSHRIQPVNPEAHNSFGRYVRHTISVLTFG
jgi:hypothetical protein